MTCWHIPFSLIIMHLLIYKVKLLPIFFKTNVPSLVLHPDIFQKSSYINILQEKCLLIKMIYASSYQIKPCLLIDYLLYFVLFILLEVEAGDFPQYSTTPSNLLLPSFLDLYFQKIEGKSQWIFFHKVSLCLIWKKNLSNIFINSVHCLFVKQNRYLICTLALSHLSNFKIQIRDDNSVSSNWIL